MTFREAFAALVVFIAIVSLSRGEHPTHKIPYFMSERDHIGNYSADDLKDKELDFIGKRAKSLGYKLVKESK
jgi:hypothetical protein